MSNGQRDITLRFLAEPGDVNFGGKVHGGAVMKWIDLAAYANAAAWSGKYCITAYAGVSALLRRYMSVTWLRSAPRSFTPEKHQCTLPLMSKRVIQKS